MSELPPEARLPLSRPVRIVESKEQRERIVISADAEERAAMAQFLGILAVDRLDADLELQLADDHGGEAHLTGNLTADVVQACVVTLEPVAAQIAAAVDHRYVADGELTTEPDIDVTPDADDPPDPIVDGVIDPGVAVTEQLVLELDPFPRAQGTEFDGYSSDPEAPTGEHPFAALSALRPGSRGGNG